jgi:hypothetical protein
VSLQDAAQLFESNEIITKSVIKGLLNLPHLDDRAEV